MSTKFSGMSTGRPSVTNAAKAKLMESLKDDTTHEVSRRVNFEVPESKHAKLKINAVRNGKSIKEFLTAYIDSLPDE